MHLRLGRRYQIAGMNRMTNRGDGVAVVGEADPLRAVRTYYDVTTERSFLSGWSAEGYGLHFGLDGPGVETHAQSLRATNDAVAEALALADGARCLDAGCGVGGTAIDLAQRRGVEVLGVTLSTRQAALARRFADEAGVGGRVRFAVADYGATGLAEGSFDAVWALESFCHAIDPRAVLGHLVGLLRPGGRFACIDMFRGDGGDPANARDLCEGWVLPALDRRDALARLAGEVGLAAVQSIDLTQRVLRSAETLLPLARAQQMRVEFERRLAGGTDEVMAGHVRGALGCARGFLDGAVTYGLVVGVKA